MTSTSLISAEQLKKMRRNARDRKRSALKKTELEAMRKLVQDLELRRDQLLQTTESPSESEMDPFSPGFQVAYAPVAAVIHSTLTLVELGDYTRLAGEVEAYRCQNVRLAKQIYHKDLFYSILRTGLLELRQESFRTPSDPRFTPLTHEEALDLTNQTLQHVKSARLLYADDSSFENRPKLFGWSQYCERNGGTMTFAIKKLMANVTPHELAALSWRALTETEVLNSLSPFQLRAKITLLQTISDDVAILDRRTEDGVHTGVDGKALHVRTIYIVFRREEADGCFTLAMKTINLPLVKKLLRYDEIWCDNFYWMHYDPKHSGGRPTVFAEFGGSNSYAREDFATLWLEEIFFLAIRWETMISPSLLV